MFRRIIGFVLALLLLLAGGEIVLRYFPPSDLRPYLGEASQLSGPFRPDSAYGVQYRSWEAFAELHREPLQNYSKWLAGEEKRPVWAFFGNSFVQAPGMLADTARNRLPKMCIFNLGRNEIFPVRLAQAHLLLERGLKPERLFVVILPLDLSVLCRFPLDSYRVTTSGALTYSPHLHNIPLGGLLESSRLSLMGWVRAGLHVRNPSFHIRQLNKTLPDYVTQDIQHLISSLAVAARSRKVPITVVLLPGYDQVRRNAPYEMQDALRPVLENIGVDVCDVRDAFLAAKDKASLFIPDRHFSDQGNRILLDSILSHLHARSILVREASP